MKWNERIKKAEKREANKLKPFFTKEDRELASLWVTGPISEYADKIELRNGKLNKGPTDIYLILDSIFFTKGIMDDNFHLANNCYKGVVKQVEDLVAGTDRITMLNKFCKNHPKYTLKNN